MKKLFTLFLSIALFGTLTHSQIEGNIWLTGLDVEVTDLSSLGVVADAGGVQDFTGYSSYKLYANFGDASYRMAAVAGINYFNNDAFGPDDLDNPTPGVDYKNEQHDLIIGSEGGVFYNHPLGSSAGGLNGALLPLPGFEALQYDTHITIGEAQFFGSSQVSALSTQPDGTFFNVWGSTNGAGELNGQDVVIFTTPDNAIAMPGDDLRIYIGQLTTNGTPYWELNLTGQQGLNDVGNPIPVESWAINNVDNFVGDDDGGPNHECGCAVGLIAPAPDSCDPFSMACGAAAIAGCTNPDACNFDEDATEDDDSCIVVEAAVISTDDETTICAGDGIADPINVIVEGGQGPSSTFVITDADGLILDIPAGTGPFDLEGAGTGTCLIWYFTFDPNDTEGVGVGLNANDITGCNVLSNPITVVREGVGCTDPTANNFNQEACADDGSCTFDPILGCTDDTACNFNPDADTEDGSCIIVTGATISTTDNTTICAGDGIPDPINVTVVGGSGPSSTFVITDSEGNILDIPTGLGPFDLEGAGAGTCLIWYLTFDPNDIEGAEIGNNANDISGCFALSNDIAVVREAVGCTDPAAANFNPDACAEDGSCVFDPILGCTNDAACNFDPEATEDDGSCIVVTAATISTSDNTEICAGDGIADPINVIVEGGEGPNSTFVITDADGNILDIPAGNGPFDLEGAGAGTCLIWYLNFDANDIAGAEVGANAEDLEGCFELSNAIEVVRNAAGCTDPTAANFDADACADDGSCVFDAVLGCTDATACNFNPDATEDDGSCEFESCAGCTDVNACNFDADATIDNGTCDYSCQGCTDETACNFEASATDDDGSCEFVSCAGCTNPLACNFDADATIDDDSCVVVTAAQISTDDNTTICAGDGVADPINVTVEGGMGPNATFVITDADGNILDIPAGNGPFDLDPAGPGTCLIWYLYFDASDITGATVGANANDLEGCFALSNEIVVERNEAGCTDPDAVNYNPDACGDDGSCIAGGDCVVECPEDIMIECGEDTSVEALGAPVVLQGDCVVGEPTEVQDGTDCIFTIVRTWTIDGFGVCEQTITVVDTTPPTFDEEIPTEITVQCITDLPAPVNYTATDDCGGVNVTNNGFELGDPIEQCTLETAEGVGADWGIWLPTLAEEGYAASAYFTFDGLGSFVINNDGTATATGLVRNDTDPSQAFELNMFFQNAADWTAWSDAGRSYKDDANLVTNEYIDWTYFELANGASTLIGVDAYDGVTLSLSHAPADYFFGFQCGIAANNRNSNEGISGWFTFNGVIDGMPVSGNGDLNANKECEPINNADCINQTEIVRIYTATDDCGNTTSVEQTIIVNDDIAPEFEGAPESITIECDEEVPAAPEVLAFDNCDGQVFVELTSEVEDGDACEGTITRTWTSADQCQNVAMYTQVITIVDSQAPVFTFVPADAQYECDEDYTLEDATAEDNCGNATIEYNEETTGDACETIITRTWVATDDCENTSEPVVQVVTISDTEGPVFDAYDVQIALECGEEADPLTATDNCSEVTEITITSVDVLGSGGCLGSIQRTYTAVDACGNETVVNQYITILDTTPPTIELPEDMTVECDEVPSLEDFEDEINVFDNCGLDVDVELDVTETPGECEDAYTITYTWTAIDYCENETTASWTITVQDTTAPVITDVPASVTLECDEEEPAVETPSIEDNCDETPGLEFTQEEMPGTCEGERTLTRIWRGFDNCGNETIVMQTITFEDTTAPEFTFVGEDMTIECDEDVPASAFEVEDNCSSVDNITVEVDEAITAGDCAQEYTLVRTYTATDDCGNTGEPVTQTINVVDTTAPVINLPDDISTDITCEEYVCGIETGFAFINGLLTPDQEEAFIECNEELFFALDVVPASVTDNCDEEVNYVPSTLIPVIHEGCVEYEGSSNVRYSLICWFTAEDDCGNEADSVYTVLNLVDFTAPVLSGVPSDITLECSEVQLDNPVTATDDCDIDAEVELDEVTTPGTCDGEYIITRTWTATDECGNTSSATQVVTVVDTTAPVFTETPADETIECDEEIPGSDASAEDLCSEVTITQADETIVDTPCEVVIERTFTATDDCGNAATYVQTITILDTTAPMLTSVPADVTYECDEDVVLEDATAMDNCNGFTIEVETVEEGDFCLSTITRTFTPVDECGNIGESATQVITIQDTTAPVIVVADDATVECDEELPAPSWTGDDNCNDFSVDVTSEIIDGDCAQEYTMIRSYVATDICGNVSEPVTQTINVVDTTAPVFAGQPELTMPCDDIDDSVLVTATDNCDDELEIGYDDEFDPNTGCAGTITRTYSVTDDCDNTAIFVQTITLIDEVAPEFTSVPESLEVDCNEEYLLLDPTYEDNCDDEVDVDYNESFEGNSCETIITRTWIITDDCGNENEYTQLIVITDTTAPSLVDIPQDATYECDEEFEMGEPTAQDDCSEYTINIETVEEGDDCLMTITRTFTPVDVCGNVGESATQVITIQDTTAPVFTSVPADETYECDETIPEFMAEAEDNCNDVTVTFNDAMDGDDCTQTITRTFTATDDCGNAETAVQIITITDTTAPVITGTIEIEMPCDMVDEASQVEVTDNCDQDVDLTWSDTYVSGSCAGRIIRDYVATDNCGNTAEFQQIIELIDDVAPVFDTTPGNLTVECDEDYVVVDPTYSDNCDDELEVDYDESTTGDACETIITRTWVLTDQCLNTAEYTQTITIVDTTAPEFTFVPADATYECDEEYTLVDAEAEDNCNEASVSVVTEETVDGCTTTITRTFVATDDCGNASQPVVQTISIVDTTAPVLTSVPADATYECDEDVVLDDATAMDNCNTVTIDVNTSEEGDDCITVITRTFTPVDACGNIGESAVQTITIQDTTAPVFTSQPDDLTFQCADDVEMATLSATDNCQDVEITCDTEVVEEDECGNSVSIVTCTAADGCGNTTSVSYMITVEDTIAPELIATPASLVLDCDDEVPAPADVTATDNCDDELTVSYSEEIIGETPAEGSSSDCDGSDPELMDPEDQEWSLWLQDFDNGDDYYVLADGTEASWITYPDGTAVLTGSVVSTEDAGRGWDISVSFFNGMDWDMWSTQPFPTNFKDDNLIVTDEYLDWTYYLLNGDDATLTGTGDYAGSVLNLEHAPSSLYYAFQEGLKANNRSENYGVGGWFYYSGVLVQDGVETIVDEKGGDFAFDLDCCPDYSIERTWCVSDCSGNETCYTQTITFEDLDGIVGGENENENGIVEVDVKGDIQIVSVAPNPAKNLSFVEFTSAITQRVSVDIYDMSGKETINLFQGEIKAGQIMRKKVNTEAIGDGMYIIKLSSDTDAKFDKLMIAK